MTPAEFAVLRCRQVIPLRDVDRLLRSRSGAEPSRWTMFHEWVRIDRAGRHGEDLTPRAVGRRRSPDTQPLRVRNGRMRGSLAVIGHNEVDGRYGFRYRDAQNRRGCESQSIARSCSIPPMSEPANAPGSTVRELAQPRWWWQNVVVISVRRGITIDCITTNFANLPNPTRSTVRWHRFQRRGIACNRWISRHRYQATRFLRFPMLWFSTNRCSFCNG